MAADTTGYLSTSNSTVKRWSNKFQRQNFEENWWLANNFVAHATGSKGLPAQDVNAPIAMYTDLERGQIQPGEGLTTSNPEANGDRVRITWIDKTTAVRTTGNSTLRGNAGSLALGYLDVIIDQWRLATEVIGLMSSKRTAAMKKTEIRNANILKAVDYIEEDIWNSIYLGAAGHLIDLTHYSAEVHPNNYHYTEPSGDRGVPGSTEKADTVLLDYICEWFTNRANPITMMKDPRGKAMGVIVMSEAQYTDLCRDNRFWELQKDAIRPVASEKEMERHPLFYKREAYYRGLCTYSTTRVWDGSQVSATAGYTDLTNDHHGMVALGARAIGWANGGFGTEIEGTPDNVQAIFIKDTYDDYGNEVNEGLHICNGIVRQSFTRDDAAADENQSSGIFWTNVSNKSF